jgi:hypothetical protein
MNMPVDALSWHRYHDLENSVIIDAVDLKKHGHKNMVIS